VTNSSVLLDSPERRESFSVGLISEQISSLRFEGAGS
jgi:hypothetical protein